jgi:pimeloyl-ACP methyl ester carboxylesterase
MSRQDTAAHLLWRRANVAGRKVNYGVAGAGLPVLFIHGWALGSHAYKRAMKRMVKLGCRVYAPALPGFGGSAQLPAGKNDLPGYGAWAAEFLDEVGVDEPALVAGHSFGGAVATQLAHDDPDRVAHLVLINSVGAGIWSVSPRTVRSMAERPLWDWVVNFARDIGSGTAVPTTVRSILEDAVPNVATNPIGLWRVAGLARQADLRAELAGIRHAGVPVTVISSEGDLVVPRASFDAMCAALGVQGKLVPGRHSWLLAQPDLFAEVMDPVVRAVVASRAAASRLPVAASQ